MTYSAGNALIIDLGPMFIQVRNYAPWVAPNIEQYNYRDASWTLVPQPLDLHPDTEFRDLTNDEFFWKTVELNQPEFDRLIIGTLFNG